MVYIMQPKYVFSKTIESPNKEYSLDIYVQKNFKHIGFSSQNAYKDAKVVLKNNEGKTILKPNCTFIIGDLNISWQLDEGKVYFTDKNFINIKNKDCFCL